MRPRKSRIRLSRRAARWVFAMTQRERQGWLIVASLWVTLFIIFGGGYLTAGVFFTPLLKQFGWGRAQLSTLQGSLAISAGVSAPLIGWLLDKALAASPIPPLD